MPILVSRRCDGEPVLAIADKAKSSLLILVV
jgi:hypothetical protein